MLLPEELVSRPFDEREIGTEDQKLAETRNTPDDLPCCEIMVAPPVTVSCGFCAAAAILMVDGVVPDRNCPKKSGVICLIERAALVARLAGTETSCVFTCATAGRTPHSNRAVKTKRVDIHKNIIAMSRAAMAVGCDGVFIEVHDNPKQAKSDGDNCLDIKYLSEYVDDVVEIYKTVEKIK